MWPAKFSIPKALFFVVRYYTIGNLILSTFTSYPLYGDDTEGCLKAYIRAAISCTVVSIGAEIILFYRVHAFAGRSRNMAIFLAIVFCGVHSSGYYLLVRFLQSLRFKKWPFPNIPACMPVAGESDFLGGVFATVLLSVSIVMTIMMFLVVRKHRDLNSTLLTTFYRDGIFYFVVFTVLSTVNIIISFAATGTYKGLLVEFSIDLHSILSTRMLLHLRSVVTSDEDEVGWTANWARRIDRTESSQSTARPEDSTSTTIFFRGWELQDISRRESTGVGHTGS